MSWEYEGRSIKPTVDGWLVELARGDAVGPVGAAVVSVIEVERDGVRQACR